MKKGVFLKSIFNKFVCLSMILTLTPLGSSNVFALTDTKVFTDPVENIYVGRSEGWDIVDNLNFSDVPSSHWAREAVVRTGAYDMVKGYGDKFYPNDSISNQEALAFILRVMGQEEAAQTKAAELKETMPQYNSVVDNWSNGYLSLAQENGLISDVEYLDTIADQNTLGPGSFFKGAPATRERVADWIVKGVKKLNSNAFSTTGTSQQSMYKFSDWDSVDVSYAQSLELLCANGILSGSNGKINPKGNLTRAEMTQILSNLDSIYFESANLEKKTGTVGGIQDAQLSQTGIGSLWRNIYIRNMDGKVDVLQFQLRDSNSPQDKVADTVVYDNGIVGSLTFLLEGDQIEYVVEKKSTNSSNSSNNQDLKDELKDNPTEPETGSVSGSRSSGNSGDVKPKIIFVKKTGGLTRKEVQGKLMEVDYTNGLVHILDNLGKRFSYPIVNGLYGTDDDGSNYIVMGEKRYADKNLPYGSSVKLALINNTVDDIRYVGDMNLKNEIRGIVVENNTNYGYLTIIDNDGKEVTKNYYNDQIEVERQEYYDMDDEVGYLDQVFQSAVYDPRDTSVANIEVGDIVFIRTFDDDEDTIESISASPNYIMKYGRVNNYVNDGSGVNQLMLQYENGQTSWFDVADSVFASKAGKPIEQSEIQAGDWVKVLVNQAIISPGYVMESIKEITVEGTGHEINTIIKGQLGAINNIQNKISVSDSYTLTKKGWSDYKEIRDVSIANNDIQYYYEGKQISLDYAMRFLKHADNDVYIALENNYSGEKVSMVSFRSSRDDVLSADTIVNSDGVGNFNISSRDGTISTDSGTIVRRHGRLVSGQNIMIPDYATVVLNGNNKAAVVDIYDQPDVSGVLIGRGRILSVDEGKSFNLKSTGMLTGTKWIYSPVERSFMIDHNTMYIDQNGISTMEKFIEYTTNSVVTKVYNIVSDGTKATHVIDSPYAKDAVRGEVVSVGDAEGGDNNNGDNNNGDNNNGDNNNGDNNNGDNNNGDNNNGDNNNGGTVAGKRIVIKGSTYLKNKAYNWDDVSHTDSSVNVNVPPNSIIVKNNKVVGVSEIEKGDKIRVMTDNLPNKIEGGMSVNGYIILVEG